MKSSKRNCVFCLSLNLLIVCQSAFGQTGAPRGLDKNLEYFVGKWTCSSKSKIIDGADTSENASSQDRVEFSGSLNSFWLQGDYFSESGNVNRCHYGRNGKNLFKICLGSYEGFSVSEAAGWIGNVLEFRGKSYYLEYVSTDFKKFEKISDSVYHVTSKIEHRDNRNLVTYQADRFAECSKQK